MNWQPFKLQFPLLFVEHINEVKKEKWSLSWSISCQDIKLLPILFLINLVKSFNKLDIYVRYTRRSVRVCICVRVLFWIGFWKGRMYGLIAYPLRWNMLLNDVVHLSTGYILSIFLSWKKNTNKPVKQNKKYKTQGNFPNKSIIIRRLTIFKIVIYTRFW